MRTADVSCPDEIRIQAVEMELSDHDFTADKDLNRLGHDWSHTIRALFTMRQMVDRWCEERAFEEKDVFHFQGLPRRVRIWDEAILPLTPHSKH